MVDSPVKNAHRTDRMVICVRNPRCGLLLLAGILLLAFPGCRGRQLLQVVPVTGTVRYQGQPLAGATIMFVTQQGRLACGEFASASTDIQGRFRLTTQVPGNRVFSGAIPGEHRVVVSKFVPPSGMSEEAYRQRLDAQEKAMVQAGMITDGEAAPPKVELLPARYSNLQQTILSALVRRGDPNDFTFELAD